MDYSYTMKGVTADRIRQLARECGFELAGVTPALPTADSEIFLEWVASGMAGQMSYLTDHRAEIRCDPRQLLPSAQSIVCVAKSYNFPEDNTLRAPSISRYARSEDYHDVLRRDLEQLAGKMRGEAGDFAYRICVDTAPLLERSYARLAGLGWIGKNTCLINQQYGSYLFLGEMLVSLPVEPDATVPYRCGTCTRCIDACPTEAIVPGPWATELDARRCISYFTIELRGELPEASREAIGQHVFGCDICQEVCPWNGKAVPVAAPPADELPTLDALAAMTPEDFRAVFRRTPVWRTKYSGLLRNVAIAMGNSGQPKFRPALETLAANSDKLIAEHARWALQRLNNPDGAVVP